MEKITGIHVYYFLVCKRKLWYFLNECHMEKENELVALGKMIDENTYTREEKHIDILGLANIDSLHNNTIRETKKSKSLEYASIWQVKYYLYVLKKHGIEDIKGELCYPKLKQTTEVSLSEKDYAEIERIEQEIKIVNQLEIPPSEITNESICKKCAYYDLCKI